MKKIIASSGAALMLMSSSFAWAEDVSGTVRGINHQAGTLTLDDGKTYTLQAGVVHVDLKPGDKVTISVQVENGKNVVNKVTKTG